jgi:hypothetical protein
MSNRHRCGLTLAAATAIAASGTALIGIGTAQADANDANKCAPIYGTVNGFSTSVQGNSHTSCPFAEDVRVAYAISGPPSEVPRDIRAYSVITKRSYVMSCEIIGPGPFVECDGGADAVVYLY